MKLSRSESKAHSQLCSYRMFPVLQTRRDFGKEHVIFLEVCISHRDFLKSPLLSF